MVQMELTEKASQGSIDGAVDAVSYPSAYATRLILRAVQLLTALSVTFC